MTKRMLDLFSCQGGAAQGYLNAGFDEVIGIDVTDHSKRYPGEFVQGDAIEFLRKYGKDFKYRHASPPCQGYSIATAGNLDARHKYERLIPAVRNLMREFDGYWVIENVELAKTQMRNPMMLCGRMFNLSTLDTDGEPLVMDRHRLFETNFDIGAPEHPLHSDGVQIAGSYGGARRSSKPNATPADDRYSARYERKGGYVPRSKEVQQQLLGIDWMTLKGMWESIPPVYAEYVGKRMLELGEND